MMPGSTARGVGGDRREGRQGGGFIKPFATVGSWGLISSEKNMPQTDCSRGRGRWALLVTDGQMFSGALTFRPSGFPYTWHRGLLWSGKSRVTGFAGSRLRA